MWGAYVIEVTNLKNSVLEDGAPDALPSAGGVRSIIQTLNETIKRLHKYEPPPPPDPNRLQRVAFKVRDKLIKTLGGTPPGEYNGPRG